MTIDNKKFKNDDNFSLSEMTADNVSWGVELMHKDCAELQFLREFTENSIQAIEQGDGKGNVVWTYDRLWRKRNSTYKACIIDNGIGMTGREIAKFINRIFSSGKQLGLNQNYGIGAKIAAAPLNPRGIEYWTWKDGKGYLAVLRQNSEGRYGLQKFRNERGGMDDWQEEISDSVKPKEIENNGVKVVLLGENDEDNTYFNEKAAMPSRWILRYLNSRYFSIPENISIKAPSIRRNEDGSIKPIRSKVRGLKSFLDEHIEDSEHKGSMEVYKGTLHWWLLDPKERRNHYTEFNSHAQSGAIFQKETYDLASLQKHRSRMQKFNLLYTYDRVAIFIEPNFDARSNTARSKLLMEDETGLPWEKWALEFGQNIPEVIREIENELFQESVQNLDQEIKERIKQWFSASPLSRFHKSDDGEFEIDEPDHGINDPGGNASEEPETKDSQPSEPSNSYSDFIEPKENRAERKEVSDPTPEVVWKTIENGSRNEGELEDRAAEYVAGKDILIINGDFRGYTDLRDQLIKEKGAGDVSREKSIEYFTSREYIFTLIEATMRTKLLNDNPNWSRSQIEDKCLSPEGLTEAVMSSYHLHYMLHQNIGRWISSVKREQIEEEVTGARGLENLFAWG